MKKLMTFGAILLLSGIALRTIDINIWQRTYAPALAAQQVKSSDDAVIKLRTYNLFSQTVIPSVIWIGAICLILPVKSLITKKKD